MAVKNRKSRINARRLRPRNARTRQKKANGVREESALTNGPDRAKGPIRSEFRVRQSSSKLDEIGERSATGEASKIIWVIVSIASAFILVMAWLIWLGYGSAK